jgi:hypothetical protein
MNSGDDLDDKQQYGKDKRGTFSANKHNGSTAPLSHQMRDSGAIVFLFFLSYFFVLLATCHHRKHLLTGCHVKFI